VAHQTLTPELVKRLAAKVSGVSGNRQEILIHGEDDELIVPAGIESSDLVQRLVGAGLYATGTRIGNRRERAWLEGMGLVAKAPAVRMLIAGDLVKERPEEWLEQAGLEVSGDSRIAVVLTDDYLRPEIAGMLEETEQALLVKPVGMQVWLGPLLTGDTVGLYEELVYWLKGKRASRARVCGWEYPPAIAVAGNAASWSFSMGWLASALGLIAAGGGKALGGLTTFDFRSLKQEFHAIRRAGGVRPGEWVSRHTGVVSRFLAEVEGFGLRHAQAEYVLPALFGNLHRQRTRGFAYGSGCTEQEARDKAVYEGIERFSAHFDGEEEFAVMAYDPERCIHPNELMLFSDEQYDSREAWNRGKPDVEQVPERFVEDVPVAWMRAKAFGDYPDLWAPAAVVLMDHADAGQPWFAVSESTGCAAGPTIEAAIDSGRRELIERDAVAMWWYRRAMRPRWDWRAYGCERTLSIGGCMEREGWCVELLDLTTEFGVAVCVAVSSRVSGEMPAFGGGAAATMAEAARKAMQELAQVLTWKGVLRDEAPYGVAQLEPFQAGVDGEVGSVEGGMNLRQYYVDLTRRRVGLPVVRVLIPGLQPNGIRLGGKRIAEVSFKSAIPCPL